MSPGARQHLLAHSSDFFGKEDSNLSEDTSIVGYHEVVRLVHDRNVVDGMIAKLPLAVHRGNLEMEELERLRLTMYHTILLAKDFHVGVKCEGKMFYKDKKTAGAKRRATTIGDGKLGGPAVLSELPVHTCGLTASKMVWNPKTVVFDFSALGRLPLDVHIRITALFFISKPAISKIWTWFLRLSRALGGRHPVREVLAKRLRQNSWAMTGKIHTLFSKANQGKSAEELAKLFDGQIVPSPAEYEQILLDHKYHRVFIQTRNAEGQLETKSIIMQGYNIYYNPLPPRTSFP